MSIKQCTCKHPAQDQLHGKGNRVHTRSVKGVESCTVCGGKARMYARLDTYAQKHDKKQHG